MNEMINAFGIFVLGLMLVGWLFMEIDSGNPCSQFSDPSRHVMCTSDMRPDLTEK
jgi:hypothetical protein